MDSKTKSTSLWKKAFKRKGTWENMVSGIIVYCISWLQDDLLDIVYWMRQLASLIVGLIWGILPLTGFVGMLL